MSWNSSNRQKSLRSKTQRGEIGKGCVLQKPKGSGNWYAIIEKRDECTGKRIRKWYSLGVRGKKNAQIQCARIITELKRGTLQEPEKTTLADFFERWLAHMKSQVSPRTHERYVEIARKNIVPMLGQAKISRLNALQISQAYTKALGLAAATAKAG